MSTVCLAMIVRDAETTIQRCLESAKPFIQHALRKHSR